MFTYQRTIRFADTDAAAVVYFPNFLSICHEAYEESLAAAGIELNTFFAAQRVMVPVSKAAAEYLRPLACGDRVSITLSAKPAGSDGYSVEYEVRRLGPPDKLAARVRTEHVCIGAQTRERQALPALLAHWLAQSA